MTIFFTLIVPIAIAFCVGGGLEDLGLKSPTIFKFAIASAIITFLLGVIVDILMDIRQAVKK